LEKKELVMNKINFGRAILGGVVAGLIINIGEFVLNEVLFKKQLEEMVRQHNLPRPGGAFIATAVVLTFILGIIIVMTYAMIRTFSGPGPKTAICAGLIFWFAIYVYAGILNSTLFGVEPSLMAIGLVWGAAEYVLGALGGAWLYKEG
jgi:polyferredoxin